MRKKKDLWPWLQASWDKYDCDQRGNPLTIWAALDSDSLYIGDKSFEVRIPMYFQVDEEGLAAWAEAMSQHFRGCKPFTAILGAYL